MKLLLWYGRTDLLGEILVWEDRSGSLHYTIIRRIRSSTDSNFLRLTYAGSLN
jgi:hypothetical protein